MLNISERKKLNSLLSIIMLYLIRIPLNLLVASPVFVSNIPTRYHPDIDRFLITGMVKHQDIRRFMVDEGDRGAEIRCNNTWMNWNQFKNASWSSHID